jgi:integrase
MGTSTAGSERQRITKRTVDALRPGDTVWDAEVTGFGVRRQRRDASFVLKYTIQRRQRFYTIGRHGVFTVETARNEARRLLGIVASGIDPAVSRDVSMATDTVTVKYLCEEYLSKGPGYKPDKKPSSWYTDASNINRHIIPLLGQIPAADVTESQIIQLVADIVAGVTHLDERVGHRARAIVKGGKGAAARSLAVLSAAYSFGVRTGMVASNPTIKVKAPTGEAPGKYLTTEEWSRLGTSLLELRAEAVDSSLAFADAVLLLALTGCRRSEITQLQWSEVDLAAGLLRLKSAKAGPRAVPLGEQAIALLAERRTTSAEGKWVFPSSRGTGPIVGIQKFWDQVRAKSRLDGARLHDLRHSFASQAVNSGASLYLTGAILGHRQASTTQRYAHLQSGPVRDLATKVGETILSALGRPAPEQK